jgi:hypothetical protein
MTFVCGGATLGSASGSGSTIGCGTLEVSAALACDDGDGSSCEIILLLLGGADREGGVCG